jgi:hypothetical protein
MIPQLPHWGLSFPRLSFFKSNVYLKMEVPTFITAYSAVDIPGLRAWHFPQLVKLGSRRGKSFLQRGQIGILMLDVADS